jgi:hypothetical protein
VQSPGAVGGDDPAGGAGGGGGRHPDDVDAVGDGDVAGVVLDESDPAVPP